MRCLLNISLFFFVSTFFSCNNENTDKIKIGFSQCSSDTDWRKSMNYTMQVQASIYSDVELFIYDSNGNVQNQIADIEKMIVAEMDIIIVSPWEPELIVDVLEKAQELGIPVVLLDRRVNSNNYTTYLGADNIEVGRNAGKYIASSSQKPINVIEIKGGDASTPVVERSLGFHQIVDNEPHVNVLRSIKGGDTGFPNRIFEQIIDSLKEKPIDFVYTFNDQMALEAWKIAKEKGKENDIKFIGVDGLDGPDGGIQMVRDGILEASILYPTGGYEVIELALNILKGVKVPKNNLLNTTLIDRFNADIMRDQLGKINQQQAKMESQNTDIIIQKKLYAWQNNLLRISIILLAIVLGLAVYSIYSVFIIRKKNRELELTNNKIMIQRNQIQKIAENAKVGNEAKINFFTAISHEFKTPITLILSSIESIGDIAMKKGFKLKNEVELIQNNSNRLLRLINQLLDFRKIEEHKFILRASKTNLFTFSNNIINDFRREAQKRNIDFTFICNNKELFIYIDRNLMDKVYFNLLSNAFKFTPDNGKIEIIIKDHIDGNRVSIYFKDSGIGIPDKEIKNVFQTFFKGSNNKKNGSGVGLHLSKEFIEMHKGTIEINSFHGSEFIISLYKGNAHLRKEEISIEQDLIDVNKFEFATDYQETDTYLTQISDSDKERYTILIIEDNKDLALFLRNKLMLEYEVHLSDGTKVVEKTVGLIPDIILCDINLSELSGFEICEILKKDLRTSHIPIILLTALGDRVSYLRGLQVGADLYLTKPFSYAILIQSIKSLLYNRESLRFYYTNNIHKIEESSSFGNLEQIFISKLNELIEKNMAKDDFSVKNLADELSISRSQLYRKVKALLGISISDYLIQFRLEKAKSMLVNSTLSISEIAYKNGFSSPNYFSTAFKNKYGESPLVFRKSS